MPGCYKNNQNHSEGAAAPYISHSNKRKRNFEKNQTSFERHGPIPQKQPKVPDRFLEKLFNEMETEEKKRNPLAIRVSTTTNGSMTQGIFYDYCNHFVSSLPPDQGKHGLPSILFLDGHASRWNVAALRYLILNNVYPFFLPSHTSIWSQPNDNGTIKRLHACIEEATIKRRRWSRAIIPYFNEIFVEGWCLYLQREVSDLTCGSNNTTSAYAKTGLFPFNPLADTWEDAITTLGLDKSLDPSREVLTQWEVRVITKQEGRPKLNEFDQKNLHIGWNVADKDGEIISPEVSQNNLLIAKMRGDGILANWREKRQKLVDQKKFTEAKTLKPQDIHIENLGDIAALKLVKFVKATSDLPLPKTMTEVDQNMQSTHNILNNTVAGSGAVQVEYFVCNKEELTTSPPSDLFEEKIVLDSSEKQELLHTEFCCSGPNNCKLKLKADPKKHRCPLCEGAVHPICGKANPDFEKSIVGFLYSTICMMCYTKSKHDKSTQDKSRAVKKSSISEKGIAYKRPDGRWSVCISNRKPMIVTQSDLTDPSKYYVTPVGSTMTSEEIKRRSAKMRRLRKREEVKNMKSAKDIAQNEREEWLKKTYLEIITSARQGTPWSYEKYRAHVRKIETPFVTTVGDYRVATGGSDISSCYKTLAGEIISAAISGRNKSESEMVIARDFCDSEARKRKRFRKSRTENTVKGSDGLCAERRLTKHLRKEQMKQEINRITLLERNIEIGEEVIKYIRELKEAQDKLTRLNVPCECEYWEINESVVQEKLKMFLKLWFFPLGGGKLSKNKTVQLEALKQFNLTKEGVENRINESKQQIEKWRKEVEENKKDESMYEEISNSSDEDKDEEGEGEEGEE